ncbi:MAG: NAD-dependent epimerase/dehydratase family protein [Actinobacteria bacterium]|nr:NAD-dependent epimerase/dehydratase family protein [Actinomycetota bacterium]
MGRRHGPALRVLVIGSTGAIGSHLCSTLRQNGTEVIGASRHIDAYDKNSLALDLANMADALATVRKLPKMDAVVISAGITGLRECENDPELSRVVNVGSQVELAKWFVVTGCQNVVFLSSNRVFDGKVANVKCNAEYSPTTEYGRQKSQAELQILSLGEAARVIRFTKVLSEESKLLVDWVKKIKAEQQISAFTDVSLSPITKDHACAVIESVLSNPAPPIVQASTTDEISYFEMACSVATQLDAAQSIVRKQTAGEVGEKPLPHSSLESSNLTAIKSPSSLSTVRKIVEKMV